MGDGGWGTGNWAWGIGDEGWGTGMMGWRDGGMEGKGEIDRKAYHEDSERKRRIGGSRMRE